MMHEDVASTDRSKEVAAVMDKRWWAYESFDASVEHFISAAADLNLKGLAPMLPSACKA
jgi:hypothetical protein